MAGFLEVVTAQAKLNACPVLNVYRGSDDGCRHVWCLAYRENTDSLGGFVKFERPSRSELLLVVYDLLMHDRASYFTHVIYEHGESVFEYKADEFKKWYREGK